MQQKQDKGFWAAIGTVITILVSIGQWFLPNPLNYLVQYNPTLAICIAFSIGILVFIIGTRRSINQVKHLTGIQLKQSVVSYLQNSLSQTSTSLEVYNETVIETFTSCSNSFFGSVTVSITLPVTYRYHIAVSKAFVGVHNDGIYVISPDISTPNPVINTQDIPQPQINKSFFRFFENTDQQYRDLIRTLTPTAHQRSVAKLTTLEIREKCRYNLSLFINGLINRNRTNLQIGQKFSSIEVRFLNEANQPAKKYIPDSTHQLLP